MKNVSLSLSKIEVKTIIYDLFAFAFITFVPALSHLISVPIYYFDPMRIILLLSIVYTSRRNVYLLTLALPLFSFIISEHPVLLKSWLMSSELMLNVFIFFYFIKLLNNPFYAALISVLASKLYYYAIKFALVSFGFISGDLVATPIYYQIIVWVLLSVFIGVFFKKKQIS